MTPNNRVWIELEYPSSNEEGHKRAERLSNMLRRMGVTFPNPVWWYEDKGCYCFSVDHQGCFLQSTDNGHWYNLDYFGREGE